MMSGHRFTRLLVAAAVLVFASASVFAAPVNVTLQFNSSTLSDTLSEDHFVVVVGELNGLENQTLPDGNDLTWDQTTSDLVMTNVGGDYWEVTFQMEEDDTIAYKFWTGFSSGTGTTFWGGWEGPFSNPNGVDGSNRVFISGTTDTTVAVQYAHSADNTVSQYFRPYTEYEDSVAVYLRVNMAGFEKTGEFDPAVDIPVKIYGGTPLGPSNDSWTAFLTLTREATSGVAASFWSGVKYVAKSDLSDGLTQNYKFVFMTDGSSEYWESGDNRWIVFNSTSEDTTIHWVYFDDLSPLIGDPIDTDIIWSVDPGALQDLGFFDRSVGDKLLISGPKGWTIPDDAIEVVFQPLTQTWIGQESFSKYPGDMINYKYLVLYDSTRIDTHHVNYIEGLPGVELWEEPSSTRGADRTYEIQNAASQQVPGDFDYNFQFYAGIPPEGVISNDITVTFSVNMAPATNSETNPNNPVFRPGVDEAFIYFESPLLMLTQGLPAYEHQIELTDPDQDGIYTAELEMTGPTVYQVGYRVGYTTDTDDVINGGGVSAGRRYYQFIWPVSHDPEGTTIWPATYEFDTIDWAEFDLPSGTPPDFSQLLSVEDGVAGVPSAWKLGNNYPNPFNPSTTIAYQVGSASKVTIEVYSILGKKVRTIVDSPHRAGVYHAIWDGHDYAGKTVSSGIYFVKMSSPEFAQVRKVTLIR